MQVDIGVDVLVSGEIGRSNGEVVRELEVELETLRAENEVGRQTLEKELDNAKRAIEALTFQCQTLKVEVGASLFQTINYRVTNPFNVGPRHQVEVKSQCAVA
jgi:hypothetical protein